jgi:hypothetical protein
VAATRPGLAAGEGAQPGRVIVSGFPPGRVRPVSGVATMAMAALAGAAVADLLWAFTPLVAVWAVHEAANRGGDAPGAALIFSYAGVAGLIALTHVAAWICLAAWTGRVAGNARVLGWRRGSAGFASGAWFIPVANWLLPAFVIAGVARASRLRRAGLSVWSWWLAWLAGALALVAGTVLTWPVELVDMFAQVIDGETVDVNRAGQLLGYQIAGRLPGALLLLTAAVLGILVVHGVTAAQYDRFDELRVPRLPVQISPETAADALPDDAKIGTTSGK